MRSVGFQTLSVDNAWYKSNAKPSSICENGEAARATTSFKQLCSITQTAVCKYICRLRITAQAAESNANNPITISCLAEVAGHKLRASLRQLIMPRWEAHSVSHSHPLLLRFGNICNRSGSSNCRPVSLFHAVLLPYTVSIDHQ